MPSESSAKSVPADRIYIAASARDARFTRICVASIRYFYPEVSILLLAGGTLERGLRAELQKYWNVGVADLPQGDYGWGFVKLEPLFGPAGERFLVLDSDTAITGPVLDIWHGCDAPFLVDDEAQSQADTVRLYYDWQKLRSVDSAVRPPLFVFNSGQWFGTAGKLSREDFAPLLEWTMPPRLRYPSLFMPGDQGILNYVLNQKAAIDGMEVAREKIMRWPGHSMTGLDAGSVARRTAKPLIVHWAGIKKACLGAMIGSDLLIFFEKYYYSRLPLGGVRRMVMGVRATLSHWIHRTLVRIRLSRRFGRSAIQ